MKITLLAVLAVVSGYSFSMDQSSFEKQYEKIKREMADDIKACNDLNNKFVKPAYVEVKTPKHKDEYIEFERNEKKALKYIDNFDSDVLSLRIENKLSNFFEENCSKENIKVYSNISKRRDYCSPTFDTYKFMQGLVYAIKRYDWKSSTKERAKAKLFEYMEQSTEEPSPLIPLLLSVNILNSMIEYGIVDKKLATDAQKLRTYAQAKSEEIKSSLAADEKITDCKKFEKMRKKEIKYSRDVGKKLEALLKKTQLYI